MSERTPAAFIGHGNPMNSLESNEWTQSWVDFALSFEKPKAILAISAHWYIGLSAVTAMTSPRTIHDFYGFPQELFDISYPAPGSPELAARVVDLISPTYCGLDADSWGLDHGTWSVLTHMYPNADVPVVQLSVHAGEAYAYHHRLGQALNPLRDEGVLILGSGNVVHNLGRIAFDKPGLGEPWAQHFDDATAKIMTSQPANLVAVLDLPEAPAAVPTPEHFLPLAFIAGIADASLTTARPIVRGCDLGSLSMTSYVVA